MTYYILLLVIDINGDNIALVNPAVIALISNPKLITSSGKHLGETSHAFIVSLMFKILTSSKDGDDLSIGFIGGRNKRKEELISNKILKVNIILEFFLEKVFYLLNTKKQQYMVSFLN